MSVRVRFAPSPTGYLHIGGARTALYSYLYAKAHGGQFILRIEDTDLERSKREFEEAQIADLKWLGLDYQEGPDKPGSVGPYRQSERLDTYKEIAWKLVDQGDAYPCFLTSAELEALTAQAESEKKSPHAYHGKYRDYPLSDAKKRIESGEEHVIRFKNPGISWQFTDLVRGEVTFPEDMVGDWVILRSSGLPVYNYCCVVDDHLMKISHVIRAEEHLNNTCRQLMLYKAMGAEVPVFAHVSLLVGEDRQKLSKRHGATSVLQYREQGYLPEAMLNYLCLLGWSHPEEKDIFNVNDLDGVFTLDRFNKSPALYDVKKLNFFNEQHLRSKSAAEIIALCARDLERANPFHAQSTEWKERFVNLFKEKVQLTSEFAPFAADLFNEEIESSDEFKEIFTWESTPALKAYLLGELSKHQADDLSSEVLDEWMNHAKKELKIKGKPLFMGTRAVLSGRAHGPDLKELLALTPIKVIRARARQLG